MKQCRTTSVKCLVGNQSWKGLEGVNIPVFSPSGWTQVLNFCSRHDLARLEEISGFCNFWPEQQ